MSVISDIMEDKGGLCKLLAIIYGILGSIGSILTAGILGKIWSLILERWKWYLNETGR